MKKKNRGAILKWGSIFLLIFAAQLLFAQTADDIVQKSKDRIKADTISSRSRMIIYAKDGTTSERLLDQYTSDTKDGARTVIVFQSPASVANTRFLTIENKGASDDRWIYLPSLGKVRRISSGESSGSFMGTDFSYEDISITSADMGDDTYRMLKEENFDGKECWVIEAIAKKASAENPKKIMWIEKDSFIVYKIEMYDKKDELVKLLTFGNFKEVQGRLTPMQMKLTTVKAGTSTEINMEIMRYDDKIPASVYTTRFLETGRP